MHQKHLCIWCMEAEDRKHGNDLVLIESKTMWNKVKSHTIYLKDEIMRDRILGVIRATPDPFATEIRYHKSCSLKYLYHLTIESDTDNVQNVRNGEIKILFLNHVRKVILELNEPRTLTGLFMDYNSFADNFGGSLLGKAARIKDMIVEEFGDEIGFHKRYHKNESTIVYSTATGGSYVEAAIYAWGISDEQLLNSAARRLKSNIDKRECMPWPPTVEELEGSEKPNPLLQKFIQWLDTPSCKNTDDCDEPEVYTLTSLLESYITRKRCTLKVQLSMVLYGLTRSREIIDIMKKLGLGISYYDVTNLYATWTKNDMEKDGQCPPEIAENYPGTAIMDNDDFKDDTLTGADTSHRTNVMFVQDADLTNTNQTSSQSLVLTRHSDLKDIVAEQNMIAPYKTIKKGVPQIRGEFNTAPTDTSAIRVHDMIHTVVRMDGEYKDVLPEVQAIGSFAGFQSLLEPYVRKSKAHYYLTLPKPPHKSVVHEVMSRLSQVAEKKNMPFLQLVGDQPVYTLIVQLKNENPQHFHKIIPILGPFHTHCSFITAIKKRFDGSGLSDILVAADVIAAKSIDQALRGKHYRRIVRGLQLLYEAYQRRIVRSAVNEEGVQLSGHVRELLEITRQTTEHSQSDLKGASKELNESEEFAHFISTAYTIIAEYNSPMANFWLSFMEMVEILVMNIHACKTQDWAMFKEYTRLMLPWLMIYDNNKYVRWLTEFWLEISSLPDETQEHMASIFAQSLTGKPYSRMPLDLWIETTMNKGSKMKAGWKHILKNEVMLLTHTRNANSMNRVRVALTETANMKSTKAGHRENTTARVRVDEQAVQDIERCICEFECDPFDGTNPTLRSLQSGLTASEELTQDFETAHKDGENQVTSFITERMFSTTKDFDATIHRNSRKNFSNPPKSTSSCQEKCTKSVTMENKAMSQIVSLTCEKKISLTQIMDNRVTEECLSIFNTNGSLVKIQKSKLLEGLQLSSLDVPEDYIAIADMGFFWRLSTPTHEDREKNDETQYTWVDYATKIFSVIMSRHKNASVIIMVNDPYQIGASIKDNEHTRRSNAGSRNVFIKDTDKLPSNREFNAMFSNAGNKVRLQKFLKVQFQKLAPKYGDKEFVYSVQEECWNLKTGNEIDEYKCQHTEADTIMFYIYHQIRFQNDMRPVVIDAEDTDVVVLSAYVAHKLPGTLAIKRKKELYHCREMCTEDMADVIVPLHIHSGADATPAFFGHGKKPIIQKVKKSEEARALLAEVGNDLPINQIVERNLESFTISHIYGEKNAKTLGECRACKWEKMKKKSTQRLPPDKDSHSLHSARVNYQTYVYKNYAKSEAPPSPFHCGWKMIDGHCEPIRFTKPALPATFDAPQYVDDDTESASLLTETEAESDGTDIESDYD